MSLGGASATGCSACTRGDRDGGGGEREGEGGGRVGWGVGKEGERKEGDFVMLWCSFWLWTRSSWMPFPLLFEAAVWPSVWPCLLVRAWSGMRLLFRPMKPQQPTSMGITWHAHPLSSHSMRRFSYRSLFLSKASSMFSSHGTVSSTMMTPLTVSDHITMSGHSSRCGVGSEELLLGQQPSSSPLQLRGTFALVVWGLSLEETDAWFYVLGRLLVPPPPPHHHHWVSVISASIASTRLWRHVYIWSELPQDERTCRRVPLADLHIAQVSSPVKPHCLWLAGVGRRL